MQLSSGSTLIDHTFVFRGPQASRVCLVGSFNAWNGTATPMRRTRGGGWKVVLHLAAGHYEYKYLVDGEWRREPECEDEDVVCPHCVPNEYGTMNCVLDLHD